MMSAKVSSASKTISRRVRLMWARYMLLLTLIALGSSVLSECGAWPHVLQVQIDYTKPSSVSAFLPGMTHVDQSLDDIWASGQPAERAHVKALLGGALDFQATPIMAWGLPDPWPNPNSPEPTDWASLDQRLQMIEASGGTPVLTLAEAPWWMKGQLQANGATQLLAASDEWGEIAYSSRILDNRMDAWLHLVQRIAERYMAPPYNVRYFQVWNELKGYYNPATNRYDYDLNSGDPSGLHAQHGYTYMYNQVYGRLMAVALSLGIPANEVKVGGPYVAMDTWSTAKQSNPSELARPYGVFDQRPIDALLYWLQHKAGAGFISFDGMNQNRDGINTVNPFAAANKFADVVHWIRSLDNQLYPGAATLPIWLAEWYATPYGDGANDAANNAIKTYAMARFLQAGGAVALAWGGEGDGTQSAGLWTIAKSRNAQPLPWYYSYQALKRYFASGAVLYASHGAPASEVAVIATAGAIMLINMTADTQEALGRGIAVSLTPYAVVTYRTSLHDI